jgi:hypothetical protein
MWLLAYLLSRGLVVLATRLVERRLRRARDEHGDDPGRGRGRRGGDGSELVLAA